MPRVAFPAMIAAIQQPDRAIIAVQVTFLDPRGGRKAPITRFRLEGVCSPEIVDAKGKQFEIPVLRPADAEADEQRKKSHSDTSRELLAAMIAEPAGSQKEWARAIGKSKSTVNDHLQGLRKLKFVDERLGKWHVTTKGKEALK